MAGLEAWLRHLSVLAIASAVAAACGGTDFSAADDPAGAGEGGDGAGGGGGSGGVAGKGSAGSSGSGTSGSTATGGTGSTALCQTADDCDDDDPCSVDFCDDDGVCAHPFKCGGDEPRCCDGECGECCRDDDCERGNDCTLTQCVEGFCTNTPGTCEDPNEYCGPDGCMPKEMCSGPAGCDDGNSCTADTCVDGLCDYAGCGPGLRCCPDGCAECCSDSQCADASPCTVNSCEGGVCVVASLCEDSELCCPNGDNTSATCGECCDASTCPEDAVACTDRTCRSGVCGNQPNNAHCEIDEICDPNLGGCTGGGQCNGPDDCGDPGACKTAECHDGECRFDNVSCSDGQNCCPDGPLADACHACCSNDDCQSASGDEGLVNCCQDDGQCHECCSDFDCKGVVAAPIASGGGIGVPLPCNAAVCDPATRRCKAAMLCPMGETCCPDGFCSAPGRLCVAAD